jgi:hypothetical protein
MVFTCFYRQIYGFAVIFVPIIQFYEWELLRWFSKYGKAMRKNRKIEESPALDSWATQVYHGSEQRET